MKDKNIDLSIRTRSDKTHVVEVSAAGFVAQKSEVKADVNSRLSVALAPQPTVAAKPPRPGTSGAKRPPRPPRPPSGVGQGPIETDL